MSLVYFDNIDDFTIQNLAQFLHPLSLRLLRATCRRMRALIGTPKKIRDWNGALDYAVSVNDFLSCKVAVWHGCKYVEKIIRAGARANNLEICMFAYAHGARECGPMLAESVRHGNEEMCRLALDLNAQVVRPDELNQLIQLATQRNDASICTILRAFRDNI